mmetsp:Transcript_114552/g.318990  ORF Transcript_114552/g.318990 Transcript_114552/m.318990 type:complete len:278 (-) Transcript_114552:432-1265(-)
MPAAGLPDAVLPAAGVLWRLRLRHGRPRLGRLARQGHLLRELPSSRRVRPVVRPLPPGEARAGPARPAEGPAVLQPQGAQEAQQEAHLQQPPRQPRPARPPRQLCDLSGGAAEQGGPPCTPGSAHAQPRRGVQLRGRRHRHRLPLQPAEAPLGAMGRLRAEPALHQLQPALHGGREPGDHRGEPPGRHQVGEALGHLPRVPVAVRRVQAGREATANLLPRCEDLQSRRLPIPAADASPAEGLPCHRPAVRVRVHRPRLFQLRRGGAQGRGGAAGGRG